LFRLHSFGTFPYTELFRLHAFGTFRKISGFKWVFLRKNQGHLTFFIHPAPEKRVFFGSPFLCRLRW
jgi:hypothetical protein